jgi:serine/threonine protein kinase
MDDHSPDPPSSDASPEPATGCCCRGSGPTYSPSRAHATPAIESHALSDAALGLKDAIDRLAGSIGKYVVREKLGEGGEADVFLAFERDVDRPPVALKVLKYEHLDNPNVVRHFRQAAERLARLDHPNIVRVRDLGRPDDEPPYVALQYASGGSLAEHQEGFLNPREVAELMLKVAQAIQHAHERGVLHGDISPSNILLEGRSPVVTDFVGKRLGQLPHGIDAGTFNYMSPQKANGQGDTVEADTFSMGAVLYELLQGAPPIRAVTAEEVRLAYETCPPRPITSFRGRRGVPYEELLPALDSVCRTAIHANPSQRYRSAQVFADNLLRVLLRKPTHHPRVPFWGRAKLWVERSPWMSSAVLAAIVALAVADVYIIESAGYGQEGQSQSTLEYNKFSAHLQAQAMLATLRKFEQSMRETATDPQIIRYLQDGVGGVYPKQALEAGLNRSRLDGIAVFDLTGTLLARYPYPGGIIGRDFSFRDYHNCVMQLLDASYRHGSVGTCLTPVYHGESSKTMEVSFAAPILDELGEVPVGYQIQSYHARRTLEIEETRNRQPAVDGQTIAMYGHRGVDRNDDKLSDDARKSKYGRLFVAAHPALFGSAEYSMAKDVSTRIINAFEVGAPGAQLEGLDAAPITDDSFVDPVTRVESLAAFAPVGATGYVIAVSTPRDVALGAWKHHWELLILSLGLLNAGLFALGITTVIMANRSPLSRDGGGRSS